jgi:hypothetical protein
MFDPLRRESTLYCKCLRFPPFAKDAKNGAPSTVVRQNKLKVGPPAHPPGCSRYSKSESTGLPIILAHRLRDLEIEKC